MKRKWVRVLLALFAIAVISVGAIFLIDSQVRQEGSKYIVNPEDAPEAEAILVLGAYVYPNGSVSIMLGDRLSVAKDLYDRGKASRFLLSGDHGRTDYDEVNTMKTYLEERNVDKENIFLDHAGFSTYESLYRARDIFKAKKILIVTQEYHLMRALYIARKMGIEAYGVASDKQDYKFMGHYKLREIAARNKDFFFVHILKPKPTFLGEAIPISGDALLSHDKQ